MTKDSTISTSWLMSVSTPDLTPDQSNHVVEISRDFSLSMAAKYVKGQKEHGGNLFDLSEDQLLDELWNEAIDQLVYLATLRRRRRERQANPDSPRP